MSTRKIHFVEEDTNIGFLKNRTKIKEWINGIVISNNAKINCITYIFCSDEYLLKINKEYLDHDYYTDIITFDNSEYLGELESDIFISIDRIRENAILHEEQFEREFHRVLIHGILHLLGFKDKTELEEKEMREKENECLALINL